VNPFRLSIAVIVAIGLSVVAASAALATYRGGVGDIAFGASGPSGNVDIYAIGVPGGTAKRLTEARSFDACPAYSPDGRTIAFCSDRKSGLEIWLMNADGSNQRQLTTSRYDALFPDFSPDGKRIAYDTRDGSPAGEDIYVISTRGGKPRRFTGAPGADEYAAWSPDAKTIAFVSHRSGSGQIWVMNAADGHGQRALTRDMPAKDEVPDWSPDGKRIAYEAAGDIWVMNADGAAQQNLTHSAAVEFGVAWSPDGKQIAYVLRDGGRKRVFVMGADGGNKHALGGTGNQLVPAWQPLR